MSLETEIMSKLKDAMRAKDQKALEALRAAKAEILKVKTSGGNTEISAADEIQIIQRLIKQRIDSAKLYKEQNREDLAETEEDQAKVLSQFLPEQLSETALEEAIAQIAKELGANTMADMGKLMGKARGELAGKASGADIAAAVKHLLNKS